jgi:hypothetical protein
MNDQVFRPSSSLRRGAPRDGVEDGLEAGVEAVGSQVLKSSHTKQSLAAFALASSAENIPYSIQSQIHTFFFYFPRQPVLAVIDK